MANGCTMSGDGVHINTGHMKRSQLTKLLHRHQTCCCLAFVDAIGTSTGAIERCVRLRGHGSALHVGHQYAKSILQRRAEFV
jgi:hypothetical protein